jgi:hypothetical protein
MDCTRGAALTCRVHPTEPDGRAVFVVALDPASFGGSVVADVIAPGRTLSWSTHRLPWVLHGHAPSRVTDDGSTITATGGSISGTRCADGSQPGVAAETGVLPLPPGDVTSAFLYWTADRAAGQRQAPAVTVRGPAGSAPVGGFRSLPLGSQIVGIADVTGLVRSSGAYTVAADRATTMAGWTLLVSVKTRPGGGRGIAVTYDSLGEAAPEVTASLGPASEGPNTVGITVHSSAPDRHGAQVTLDGRTYVDPFGAAPAERRACGSERTALPGGPAPVLAVRSAGVRLGVGPVWVSPS